VVVSAVGDISHKILRSICFFFFFSVVLGCDVSCWIVLSWVVICRVGLC
jgi:hypothetical protein